MKRIQLLAGGLALTAMFLGAALTVKPLSADNASPSPFLVLNVKKVFSDYKKFQMLGDQLKNELDSKEKQLMQMEQEIKAKVDGAQSLNNQEDRDNVQRDVQTMKFEYEKTRRDARQEFLTKEADMYATVYAEMYEIVKAYCTQHGYYCVLRADEPESLDKSTPNKILQTLNREVVFHHPNLDLTGLIVEELNKQYMQAANKGANPVR